MSNFKDLFDGLAGLSINLESMDKVNEFFKEKLSISLVEMQEKLSSCLQDRADEVAKDFINIAPFGDYSKLLESHEEIAEFFKTKAHYPENWAFLYLQESDTYTSLLEFVFESKALDKDDNMRGYVYVSMSGKIRHAFIQAE